MTQQTQEASRRDVLTAMWGTAGALVMGEALFAGLRFLAPRSAEGEFGGRFTVGAVESFPPGSVTPVEAGRFYVVRLDDGGFLALYRRCTHLGCSVPYDLERGQFVCPCHGSAFTLDGDVLNAPAPRPLDRFALTIEGDQVVVDTSTPIERAHVSRDHIVYPGENA